MYSLPENKSSPPDISQPLHIGDMKRISRLFRFWITMTKQGDERHDDWMEGRDGDNVYIYPDRIVIVRKFQFSKNTWVFPINSIAYYNYLEEIENGKPKGNNEN